MTPYMKTLVFLPSKVAKSQKVFSIRNVHTGKPNFELSLFLFVYPVKVHVLKEEMEKFRHTVISLETLFCA